MQNIERAGHFPLSYYINEAWIQRLILRFKKVGIRQEPMTGTVYVSPHG